MGGENTMQPMYIIGYWIRSLNDDAFPPPHELLADYDASTRQIVSDYLDHGMEFAAYRGNSWCRFFCDHPMGSRELTDGNWVWPEGLSHYVRDHNVRLPNEFIDCALSQQRPLTSPECDWSQILPNESFWIKWCADNRTNSLQSRIQSARARADAEVKQLKTNMIAERERSEGLSQNACQWRGCNNRALVGRVLCAFCILESEWESKQWEPYFNLRPALT